MGKDCFFMNLRNFSLSCFNSASDTPIIGIITNTILRFYIFKYDLSDNGRRANSHCHSTNTFYCRNYLKRI